MSEENKERLKKCQNIYHEAKFFFSLHGIIMEQKVLILDKQCVNKNWFYKNKIPISIDKVEIRRIVLSKKDSNSKRGSIKYFIGYINKTNVFPILLCTHFFQMYGYVKVQYF